MATHPNHQLILENLIGKLEHPDSEANAPDSETSGVRTHTVAGSGRIGLFVPLTGIHRLYGGIYRDL